ncbi:MAG: hypothetical protein EPO07_00500 [Verrucomicrobia bacterium]|nr:MAG: hypothetical protein EPO07_00500 [Verrucomicrobiota bacterium]
MNRTLQNLLMTFALGLCALIAYQWHRETRSHARIQELLDKDVNNQEQIRNIQSALKNTEEEVRRLEGIRVMLTDTVKSNRVEIADLKKDLDKATAENDRQSRQIDAYKVAVETANENIKKQNEAITTQNDMIKKMSEERAELVAKYNKTVEEFNDLAKKWNDQQNMLSTNAPPKK